ncbi:MAG: hypothetical protein EOP07_04735 [Proteobacteria bacterium]|nr:MAG: hypothetical protein EOP07_04735 [Pseudomonadota bacterium]
MPLARLFLIICALFSASCSTVPKETPKGKVVKVIKSPFAETCIQLAKIKYDGTPFIHDKELSVIMKELTAQNKGNAVRYDVFTPGVTGVSNAKARATAFRCHKAKLKKYLLGLENKAFGEESEEDPEFQEAKAAHGAGKDSEKEKSEAAPAAKSKSAPPPAAPAKKPGRKAPADASSEP